MKSSNNPPAPSTNPGQEEAHVKHHYDRIAPRYEQRAHAMAWLGFRDKPIHRAAVRMLDAQPGQTVVVMGVGTGLDLPALVDAVGPTGHIIGVDISQGMLDQAQQRINDAGWTHVELVQSDGADYTYPPDTDRVLAAFTLLFQPRHRQVIQNAANALQPGGRLVIADIRIPRGLRTLALPVVGTFGHTRTTLARRPHREADRLLTRVATKRFFLGMAHVVAYDAPITASQTTP